MESKLRVPAIPQSRFIFSAPAVSSEQIFDPHEHVGGFSVQRWWDSLRQESTWLTGVLADSGFDLETRNKMNGNTALILS